MSVRCEQGLVFDEQCLVCPILTIILYYVSVYFVYPEHNVTVCLFALTLVRISANLSEKMGKCPFQKNNPAFCPIF